MSVKVSVIVPVYNPGKYIEPCIESLLGQTLPAQELELLFVDDGSTDDSPARLDELAAEHSHVRVIHIPNSGWPGKPRNIGVTEARGEYVHFVDQDDFLAPDALRRLWEMGHRNRSDIVIGKVASNFRGVPHGVFRTNREKCTIHDAPLVDSLTPHKMFRTRFLRDNALAYPEGRRRLEDQLYMMEAYFPAKVVSILGDYTCYHYSKRDDGKNAGSAKIVPAGYYGNLREVLDVVVANTEPGTFRDDLLRRFYRVEMLGRISEPAMPKYDAAYRDEMIDAIRELAADHVNDGVHDGLGAILRLRSTVLRRDRREDLVEIARRASTVKGVARLEELRWEDGRIAVTITARLVWGEDRRPLSLLRRGERYYLHPEFHQGLLDDGELIDVTDELDGYRAEVSLRDRETAVEWACPAEFDRVVEELPVTERGPEGVACEVRLRGVGYLDPKKVRGRDALHKGMWDVWVPVRGLGMVRKARLGADRAPGVDAACLPALLGSPARLTVPYFTHPHGNLTLDVDRRGKKIGDALAGHEVLRVPGDGFELELAAVSHPGTAPARAWLVLRGAGADAGFLGLPATLEPVGGRVRLCPTDAGGSEALFTGPQAGTWQLSARLDGGTSGPELKIGQVRVDDHGRMHPVESLATVDPATALEAATRRRRSAQRSALRRIGRPMMRRLNPATRKRLRRLGVRLGA
ncbi:Glycosyltransferase involved in cell wall bisynthesis [Actinacidiphila yanglinensis]|uniref:Glycosyltransferase involved in cell wall bisynthesis n=1 Tax=Actinacidiphila yanglinensis TaxID=310779 RepID=A0A1H6BAZ7_9ACTN|nr:glycosyltransferase family 2 protein [Actinacidiphila yanglinensis]SEG57832.1 Glycosyltransferase involved in cell wall bisynthesis [Actinacidiphila yanglinensis]